MTEAVYGVLNVFGTLQRAGAAAARLDDWTTGRLDDWTTGRHVPRVHRWIDLTRPRRPGEQLGEGPRRIDDSQNSENRRIGESDAFSCYFSILFYCRGKKDSLALSGQAP